MELILGVPIPPPPESIKLLEGLFEELNITNKGAASGFTASKCKVPENCGFSASFPVPFMRPRLIIDILENFTPSTIDIKVASIVVDSASTANILPCKIHETNEKNKYEFSVETIAGNEIEKYLSFQTNGGIEYKRQMYIRELIEVSGIVTDSSHSDGIVYSVIGSNQVGTGVVELKDTAFAPLEQLGQLFATASQLVLGQLKHGLPHDKCYAAIMASNGHLYQFGFVTLLFPSFPVLHLTSHVLDSLDSNGRKLIAHNLYIFREACAAQDTQLRKVHIVEGKVFFALDSKAFYQKPISKVFRRCASHLQSVLSLYKIYQRLSDYRYEEAVLPVAVRSGVLDERQYLSNDCLLFPMLPDEFRMGMPLDDGDFQDYLDALTLAYKRMHSCGVIHLDGYPSNILWKKDSPGVIVIRFVDFDVASFIGCKFDRGIGELLESLDTSRKHYYWHESDVASEKHDAWFVYLYSQMTQDERKASSQAANKNDEAAVVTSYWNLVRRLNGLYDQNKRNMVDEFNGWFIESWQKAGVKGKSRVEENCNRENSDLHIAEHDY